MASSTFEEKLIRLNGSAFDAEITAIQTNTNDNPAIQVIVTDISERKKTEQALKKIEEKYRLLTVTISDYKWAINSEGIITYVSPFHDNFLGHPAEVIIKNNLSKFLALPSVLSSLIELEEMKSIVQSGRKMEPRKLILESIRIDGETKWIEVTTTAMYDSANNFIGFSGICQDITKEKNAEQIIEENTQLRENELHLKEIIETKDKFLSIIAHDLRSPFNSIIGFLELLETKYDEFSDSERKENIGLISENAKTTLNLLENLLLWAKSQTSRMAFQPFKQKLDPIIKSLIESFNSALNLKRLTIKLSIPDDLEIFADTNMLICIFHNLVSNAIKYSKEGGEILIDAQEIQNQIEIIVSDNGTGMSEQTINKLFKVAEDISIPGTYNEKGSGLGLILCKDFVERHNGSIFVKSELGKGSQFIIKIPQI
jgi:PAS domain S-box-containing protein